MKKLTFLTPILINLFVITSCKKPVIDMNAPNGNNNSASNVGNNSGSNGSNNNFNWSGTAPLSVKINGTPFQYDPALTEIMEFAGYYNITFQDVEGVESKGMTLNIGINATPGSIYNIPSPFNLSYQIQTQNILWGGSSGKYKIVTNDATTLEGYFYAVLKDYEKDSIVGNATEGYFKITKP